MVSITVMHNDVWFMVVVMGIVVSTVPVIVEDNVVSVFVVDDDVVTISVGTSIVTIMSMMVAVTVLAVMLWRGLSP